MTTNIVQIPIFLFSDFCNNKHSIFLCEVYSSTFTCIFKIETDIYHHYHIDPRIHSNVLSWILELLEPVLVHIANYVCMDMYFD